VTTLQQQARALGDPTRYGIFAYLQGADRPVGIAELTAEFGVNHNAIRQHLAKLLDAGLVDEDTEPTGGRGRPRLIYRVTALAGDQWGGVGPYERLSMLLTEMLSTGESAVEVGRRAGAAYAIAPGPGDASITDVVGVMSRLGFDPEARVRGRRVDLVLQSCPFASAVLVDPDVVCELHLGIAEGLAAGTEQLVVDELVAKDPHRAGCRLKLHLEHSA
jgi:predicted ArsR family transcriptional regulator